MGQAIGRLEYRVLSLMQESNIGSKKSTQNTRVHILKCRESAVPEVKMPKVAP